MKKIVLALLLAFGVGLFAGHVAEAAPRDSAKAPRFSESRGSSKAYILTDPASDALTNLCGQINSQGASNAADKDILAMCKKCDANDENCRWVLCDGQGLADDGKDLLSLCKKCDANGENCKWVSCGDQ